MRAIADAERVWSFKTEKHSGEQTHEEVSTGYCGPRRPRRDRACTRSRSRPARTYTKAPAYVAPIYNWTGFYIGGHIGGAFGGDNNFGGLTTGNNGDGRFLGGLQGGDDYQFAPNWVLGVEGQYSWLANNNSGIAFPGGFVYTNNQRALGSVTGRIGYTWGPGLLYVKGGYAYSDNDKSVTVAGVPTAVAFSGDHHNGYTVGAGLEYMFTQNWSGKIEYQYYNFGNSRSWPRRAGSVRQLPHRRPRREGWYQLSLQLGWPGRREVLIQA